jgi:hypothetical protein
MGFISKLALGGGKIGKVGGKNLLKYGTAFIPGVGPLVSMGINAATSAADAKMEGGSWGDAVKAGAIGGATGYMGAGGFGKLGKLGKTLAVANTVAPLVGEAVASRNSGSNSRTSGIGPSTNPSAVSRTGQAMPKGGFRYSENPLNQYDQSSPNLSMALHQGRQEAIRNQPFRKGYDIKTLTGYENDDTTKPTYAYSSMPRIQSDRPDKKKRRNLDNSEVTPTPETAKKRGGLAGIRDRVQAY